MINLSFLKPVEETMGLFVLQVIKSKYLQGNLFYQMNKSSILRYV